MLIKEKALLKILDETKNALLLEPSYRRRYMPLGLAKIATYIKNQGGKVTFKRSYDAQGDYDNVFIASLFSFDAMIVKKAILDVKKYMKPGKIVVGGIYATLMAKILDKEIEGLHIFPTYSKALDACSPDHSIDWFFKAPWDTFSYVFTSRGCPNRCPYCAVWRIEPEQWINPNWKNHIMSDKPNVVIGDNNLSDTPMKHIISVIEYMVENDKRVIFDSGLDCKLITDEMAKLLAKLKFTRDGMRLAFDRIEEDAIFKKAVETLAKYGMNKRKILVFVLYNFNELPAEANYRMERCRDLGVRPYPQRYAPLNHTSRKNKHVGKHWTPMLAQEFGNLWNISAGFTRCKFGEYIKRRKGIGVKDFVAWNQKWEKPEAMAAN